MKTNSSRLLQLLALAISLTALTANAQNFTWTGAGAASNTWGNGTNWGGTGPAAGGNQDMWLAFSFSDPSANAVSINDLTGNFTLNRLTLTNTGPTQRTVQGNQLNFVANSSAVGPSITFGATNVILNNAVNIATGTTLTMNATGSATGFFGGLISGNSTISILGGAHVFQNAANNFSGGITLSTGQLIAQVGSTGAVGAVTQGAFGTGTVRLNGGTLRATGTVNATINNNVEIGGNVQFGNLSPDTSRITLGGNVTLTGNATRVITLSAANGTHSPIVLDGMISGTGSGSGITVGGTGTLLLSGNGSNTYTGNTTVNNANAVLLLNKTGADAIAGQLILTAGTARLGQSNQVADTSNLGFTTAGTGIFDLNGRSETINTIVGAAGTTGTITSSVVGNSTLTLSGNAAGDTQVSIIDGNGTVSLVKNGGGSLILRASSTYSGGTTLNGGLISLITTSALGTGNITLNGGSLRTQDTLAQNFSNNVAIGGNFTFGIGSSNATMTFNGATTILGSAATRTLTFNSGNGTNRTPVAFVGAIGDGGNGNGLIINTTGTSAGVGNFTTVAFGGGAADSAANTYTGLTTVSGAQTRLLLNKADGTNAIAGNLTLTLGRIDFARSNQIANTSDVTVGSGGIFDLGGNSETITSLALSGNGTTVANGTLTTSGGTNTVTITSLQTVTISANVAGTNDLVKSGDGILFLSGNNTYSGGTLIQQGTGTANLGNGSSSYGVVLQANNALGTGPLTIGDATTTTAARLALNGYNQTVSSLSSGSAGTRVIEANGNAGGALSTLTVNQATNTSYTGILRDNNTLVGALALVKTGIGTLDLSSIASATYTGGLTVNDGTLIYDNVLALGSGTITLGGGTLSSSNATSTTVARPTITLTANTTSTLNNAVGSVTFSGNFTGGGALAKSGAGTTVLSGNNTYTGATTVSVGTLLVNGSTAAGSAVSVESGATLGGSGTINGATTILSGGTLSPGNSPGLTTMGSTTFNTGSDFKFELIGNTIASRGTNYDGVNILTASTLTIQSGVTSSLVFNVGSTVNWNNAFWNTNQAWLVFDTVDGNYSGPVFGSLVLTVDSAAQTLGSIRSGASFAYTINGGDIYLNYTAIPEPATWMLLVGSLTALVILRRRRTA